MSRRILENRLSEFSRPALLTVLVYLSVSSGSIPAADPLSSRIDTLILKRHTGPVTQRCTVAEFLRRVTLDLTGTIPTATEARAFLDDKTPGKREKLIDRLLNSPLYIRHMANVFDIILMERRKDKHVKSPEWQQYLQQSFAATAHPEESVVQPVTSSQAFTVQVTPSSQFGAL